MLSKTFLALATVSSAFALTVNSPPALVECQPAQLSWSGGEPPYFPSILPGGQPSGTPLLNFPQTSDTSLTWTVNITAGTSITIAVTDKSGQPNYSSQLSIQKGSETNCAGTVSGGSSSSNSTTGSSGAASGASGSAASGSSGSDSTGTAQTSAGAAATGMSGATTGNSGSASGSAAGSSASGTTKPSSSSSSSSSPSSSTSGGALPLAVMEKSTGVMAILGAIAATLL